MYDINSLPIFFLGANSVSGYISRFSDCYDVRDGWTVWILKGGPGTGKSTFMKHAAAAAAEKGERVELAACTADPDSLDGVIIPDRKLAIFDGTSPHTLDPEIPGACGRIINPGEFWDEKKLNENRSVITALCDENRRLHERAARYMAAASSLIGDSSRIALDATDTGKAARFAERLAQRIIPKSAGKAREQVRFLSGITPAGVTFFGSTVRKLCDRTVEICDEYGAASQIILSAVRRRALDNGYSIISCRCPLHPLDRLEHLIIPELSLAFCTTNRFIGVSGTGRRIHATRFTDRAALKNRRQKLMFNRRTVRELVDGAAELISEAKQVHDRIESYYTAAMDFDRLQKYFGELLSTI